MNITIYYITSNHTYFLLVSKSVRNGESFTFYGGGCYITFPEREMLSKATVCAILYLSLALI